MIEVVGDVFMLQTARTSYWFRRTEHGHLEHLHYGPLLPPQTSSALGVKRTDRARLERRVRRPTTRRTASTRSRSSTPGIGQGDYRMSPIEAFSEHGADTDFTYRAHRSRDGVVAAAGMPTADGGVGVERPRGDARRRRGGARAPPALHRVPRGRRHHPSRGRTQHRRRSTVEAVSRQRAARPARPGLQASAPSTAAGSTRAHAHDRPVSSGIFSVGTTTGRAATATTPACCCCRRGRTRTTAGSSASTSCTPATTHQRRARTRTAGAADHRHPPAVVPLAARAGRAARDARGGDRGHRRGPERALRRDAPLRAGPRDAQRQRGSERPVVLNTWEALSFDLDERRLLQLAKQAAKLGVELFVIDDGWFAGRDDDTAALGDYTVDAKKFPAGLGAFAAKVRKLGMQAGIWVEPEMVTEDSDLYRAHPDWVLRVPGKTPREGRHQQVLDLCNPAVRDYLVDAGGRPHRRQRVRLRQVGHEPPHRGRLLAARRAPRYDRARLHASASTTCSSASSRRGRRCCSRCARQAATASISGCCATPP